MLDVRFLVDSPDNWISSMTEADSTHVKIMGVKVPKEGVTEDFVELSSEKMSPEELVKHLRESHGVLSSNLSKLDRHRVVGTITTHDCPVCSTFAGLNCFLVSASTTTKGKMEWELFISKDDELKALCERLEAKQVKYEILEVSHRLRKREITSRQEQILRVALDLGYFEFPKRIKLEGLSEKLNISIGTLAEILRRAEKHVLSSYFEPS
jgi:hypothetical protein